MQPLPASATPATEPRRFKQFIFAIVGLLFALLAFTVWAITLDIDPPDTTDLETPPPLNMASADFFEIISEIERQAPNNTIKPAIDIYHNARFKNTWDQTEVDKLLESDSATKIWPLVSQALKASRGRSNWGGMPSHSIMYSINLAHLMSVRALNTARQGNPDQALSEAFEICALGTRMAESENSLVGLLAADAIQGLGIICMRTLSEIHSFSDEALLHAMGETDRCRITSRTVAELLKGEFTMMSRFLGSFDGAKGIGKKPIPIKVKIAFKPNLTRQAYAKNIRDAEALLLSGDNIMNKASDFRQNAARLDKHYINQFGYELIIPCVECLSPALCRWAEVESQLSALQAFFALRLYQNKHNGSPPESLDALVSAGILTAIPRDYADGQPIRYSKELRITWTIGRKNWNPPFPPPDNVDYDNANACIFRLDWPNRQID